MKIVDVAKGLKKIKQHKHKELCKEIVASQELKLI